MEAKPGVLERLNDLLTIELTAINQYFVQAHMMRDWGYDGLYKKLWAFSRSEMDDAQDLVEHILYLEGLPNVQRLNLVRIGETPLECLELDLTSEREAVEALREVIAHCQEVGDFTSRAKAEAMIADEETHVDWLETQLETVRQIGIERYLAEQLREEG